MYCCFVNVHVDVHVVWLSAVAAGYAHVAISEAVCHACLVRLCESKPRPTCQVLNVVPQLITPKIPHQVVANYDYMSLHGVSFASLQFLHGERLAKRMLEIRGFFRFRVVALGIRVRA